MVTRTLLLVAACLVVAAPVAAESYAGVGQWTLINPGFSTWSSADPISWNYTTGSEIAPGMLAITDFSMQVGSESWTLADYVPNIGPAPFAILLPTGLEVVYTGVNGSSTALHTGLLVTLGPSSVIRPTSFGVWNFGQDFSGGIGGLGQLSAVPEPSSWAMLIAGFGLAGAIARKRRIASVPS